MMRCSIHIYFGAHKERTGVGQPGDDLPGGKLGGEVAGAAGAGPAVAGGGAVEHGPQRLAHYRQEGLPLRKAVCPGR